VRSDSHPSGWSISPKLSATPPEGVSGTFRGVLTAGGDGVRHLWPAIKLTNCLTGSSVYRYTIIANSHIGIIGQFRYIA